MVAVFPSFFPAILYYAPVKLNSQLVSGLRLALDPREAYRKVRILRVYDDWSWSQLFRAPLGAFL